jgi:hypothetical protein
MIPAAPAIKAIFWRPDDLCFCDAFFLESFPAVFLAIKVGRSLQKAKVEAKAKENKISAFAFSSA